jgi:TRAP-type mannitol/chloroaromatic compound transport system permease large subunit
MLPKLLPRDPPAFLSFQSAVRSIKPTGMMVVSPILSGRGADAGAAAAAAGACGAAALSAAGGSAAHAVANKAQTATVNTRNFVPWLVIALPE